METVGESQDGPRELKFPCSLLLQGDQRGCRRVLRAHWGLP